MSIHNTPNQYKNIAIPYIINGKALPLYNEMAPSI